MFESAELGHTVDKSTYKAEVPALRQALLDAQFDLAEGAQRPVIILLSGADGSGKREVVHTLTEWMDPRYTKTHAIASPRARNTRMERVPVSIVLTRPYTTHHGRWRS